jgi:hypothetical protein
VGVVLLLRERSAARSLANASGRREGKADVTAVTWVNRNETKSRPTSLTVNIMSGFRIMLRRFLHSFSSRLSFY